MPKDSKRPPAPSVRWLDAPEAHDFPAAARYLSLVAPDVLVQRVVAALQAADTTHQVAKDILRAAGLVLLDSTNEHVASDLGKVARGEPLSPVLMVRGDLASGRPAVIADGYHRVCASYHVDENTDIPVRIVDLPRPS